VAVGGGHEEAILRSPIYMAKKLHEAERFGRRARELKPRQVVESARKRATSYKELSLSGLILDVGCGYGPDALAILEASPCEVVGFDISLGALELAKEVLKGRRAYLLAADATDMPFKDRAFDVVNISYMLHHHPWLIVKRIISEVARILKPGGKLTIREPCPRDEKDALLNEIRGILHELQALRELSEGGHDISGPLRDFLHLGSHMLGFGNLYLTALKGLLASSGFRVVKVELFEEERDLLALLRRAEERYKALSFSEAEEEFIRYRLEDLRHKVEALGARVVRELRAFIVAVREQRGPG